MGGASRGAGRGRRALLAALLAAALAVAATAWHTLHPARTRPDHAGAVLVRAAPATTREVEAVAVVKIIELVGESPNSWQEAVQNAIQEAAKTVDHITGVEVLNATANVRDNRLTEYKANVKVAFVVDSNRRGGA